jgi:glycerophosphoryl diester phosphodiesterase
VPLALAHRGDWSEARENTVAAFRAAERAGADMIELDVRRTADDGVVVMHDPTLERVWGSPLAVADSTLAELCRVQGVTSLDEALGSVAVPVMVDFTLTDVVDPALDVIRRAEALDRVLFSGGNVDGHRRLRELAPTARIALTWKERKLPPGGLLDELSIEYFNPPWGHVGERVVELMRERGCKVSTWTVDDPVEMRRVVDCGVDAVITNRVAELVALLAEAPC